MRHAWSVDPYTTDAVAVRRCIAHFFAHAESCMILRLLPEGPWTRWIAQSAGRKSPADIMLLYSVLALGVMVVGGEKKLAAEYAQVAMFAQRNLGYRCLQLIQSRMILSVYSTALANHEEATQLLGEALKDAYNMPLYVELDSCREANMTTWPMGLSRAGYSETRRRTMWSLFMLERLNGMFPSRPLAINAKELRIRLPMDNQSFEQQADRWMPQLDMNNHTGSASVDTAVDIPSALVKVVHLWTECQSGVYTMINHPNDPAADEAQFRALLHMATSWYKSLPHRLTSSSNNLESACFSGNATAVLAINILYSQAILKLNRYRHGAPRMPANVQERFSDECHLHAWKLMDMIRAYERLRHDRPSSYSMLPFPTIRACIEAIDVLTATGSMSQTEELCKVLRSARAVIETMATVWDVAGDARYAVERRLGQITHIEGYRSQSGSPFEGYQVYSTTLKSGIRDERWSISEPLDNTYPRDTDIVYATC